MQETVAVVSLKNIRANAAAVCAAAKKPLIAVVKDDAYGHGGERVALELEDMAAAFAVASVTEGAALRTAGVSKPVLVLTPCLCGEEAARAAGYSLTVTVSSRAALHVLERAGEPVEAHLAVNTGMNRYGVREEQAGALAREAKRAGIAITGVYSHLYAPEDGAASCEQRARFVRAAARVREVFPQCVRHLSATGGLLAGDGFDAVRAGIALYGYLPQGFAGALPVRPAMKFYAAVSHRTKQVGRGAGYGEFPARGALHTLRVGYGDGLFRAGMEGALGALCMDACVGEGDDKFGRRRRIVADVSAYARAHGTTEYEALVRLAAKAVKIYE